MDRYSCLCIVFSFLFFLFSSSSSIYFIQTGPKFNYDQQGREGKKNQISNLWYRRIGKMAYVELDLFGATDSPAGHFLLSAQLDGISHTTTTLRQRCQKWKAKVTLSEVES